MVLGGIGIFLFFHHILHLILDLVYLIKPYSYSVVSGSFSIIQVPFGSGFIHENLIQNSHCITIYYDNNKLQTIIFIFFEQDLKQ